jgi:hypothetical protein
MTRRSTRDCMVDRGYHDVLYIDSRGFCVGVGDGWGMMIDMTEINK